ncbi:MAG: hypothetical protein HFI10_04045 [Lachnospiraceae bacterium]|jgi:hypothetical protein|nr:hypothetical protein [Lachnospiraceae bacterium]
MLYILLNWLYIFITTLITGFGILFLLRKAFGYSPRNIHTCVMTGLVALTAYAQWFSLFYRVNIEANLILILVDIVIFILLRKPLWQFLISSLREVSRGKKIAVFLLILVCAYFTSRGSYISDTGLYHAQCIRWLEEYGILKGLANIQSRAAYNSSAFCLSALYSMKYIFGQSMHAVQGFMALLLCGVCLDIGAVFKRRTLLLSDFLRLGAIYYLTLLHREILSPSSDFAVMITLFYILINWLDLLERKEASTVPYALLCVAGVYTVTLKLTAGLILVLLVKPVVMLVREKKWKEIITYVMLGSIVIAPFLIRNVIISGWLIYPLTALDLFDVDWKVPAELVDADSYQIRTWGKGIHEYELYGGPTKWWPNWFKTTLSTTEKGLILADGAALLLLIGMIVKQGKEKRANEWDKLLVMITAAVSFLFWQFSAPLVRYGYAYVLSLALLVFGEIYIRLSESRRQRIILILISMFFIWKGATLTQGIWSQRLLPYYIAQADYDHNEGGEDVREHQVNGITFYYNVMGYHKLPGGGSMFTLRSDRLEDGFRYEYHDWKEIFGVAE